MRWPADHPLLTDPVLRPFAAAADDLASGSQVIGVLRHLPGRRVATLIDIEGRSAVLKVFASPRARGNDRRLRSLSATSAAGIVPSSIATDRDGHVHLVSYHPGVELDRLADPAFVASCRRAGAQLRRLHDCGAQLDRRWGWAEEVAQLRRQVLPAGIEDLSAPDSPQDRSDWVCAHRDCHPGQVIVGSAGDVRWVDLDDCAMAPRALDVGNMIAHLRRENLRGARDLAVATLGEAQFMFGYQLHGPVRLVDLDRWIDIALLRLAALAATRHSDLPLHDKLLSARARHAIPTEPVRASW